MAESLRDEPNLEVHLLRDGDEFIDLWDRGALATDLKGERHGVFISIHANSFPARRSARGFETYFLSEARTDDERREPLLALLEAWSTTPFADHPEDAYRRLYGRTIDGV